MFPFAAANPKARYNWDIGTIERSNDDDHIEVAIPPVWPLEPAPIEADSKRTTVFPGAILASHAAAARPVNPPPTTAKSASLGKGARVG